MHEIYKIVLLIKYNLKFFDIKEDNSTAYKIALDIALYASLGIFTYPMTEQQFQTYWKNTGVTIPKTPLGHAFQENLLTHINTLLQILDNPWEDNSSYYQFLFYGCLPLNIRPPDKLPIFSYQNVYLPLLIQASSLASDNINGSSLDKKIEKISKNVGRWFARKMIKRVLLLINFIFAALLIIGIIGIVPSFFVGAFGIAFLLLPLMIPLMPTFSLVLVVIGMFVGVAALGAALIRLVGILVDKIDGKLISSQSISPALFNIISNALRFCLTAILKPLEKLINWRNSKRYREELKSIYTWRDIREIEDSRDNTYKYTIKELNEDNDSILSVNLECRDDEKDKEKIIENDNEQEKNLDSEETFYGEDEEAAPLTVSENFVGGSSSPSS